MSRVSSDTIEKLTAFIESLPTEAKSKCALCNETLTHIVKQAEAQTGAGTATVTSALANHLNEGAAPGDVVSGSKLRDRVRYAEGSVKVGNSPNKPWPKCKNCGTEDVTHLSARRPTGDGLCSGCRRGVEAKLLKKAQEDFDSVPVDTKSEDFWSEFIKKVGKYLDLEEIPSGKITQATLKGLGDAYKILEVLYAEIFNKSQRPGT